MHYDNCDIYLCNSSFNTKKKIILQTKAHCIDSVILYLMVDKMSAIFNTYSTI